MTLLVIGLVLQFYYFGFVFSGIMIKTLADASTDQRTLSTAQIIFNICGFCLTVTTTVIITIYAKRRLKELQMEEEPLLQ